MSNTNIVELDRRFPLGAEIDPPDERDYDLADFLDSSDAALRRYGSKMWVFDGMDILNQGREGACVLFGTTTALNCEPRRRRITDERALSAYHYVTENDSIPGTWRSGQSGSYPRDGAKYWQEKRLFVSYAFTRDVDVIVSWILNHGPVCMSSDWLVSMDYPDEDYFVRVDYSRGVRGRHLYCLAGVEWPEDPGSGERYFRIPQTWGEEYGYEGRVRLSEAGIRELLKRNVNNQAMTFTENTKRKRKV